MLEWAWEAKWGFLIVCHLGVIGVRLGCEHFVLLMASPGLG